MNLYSSKKRLIFLLRHGQIQNHEKKRFIGKSDLLLDDIGRNQALFWRKIFVELAIKFDAVYSSELKRCAKTAKILFPDKSIVKFKNNLNNYHHHYPNDDDLSYIPKNIIIDHRLNEIDMGSWDGKSFEEIKKEMPLEFEKRGRQIQHFRPSGGESFNDLLTRVTPFFNDLLKGAMSKKERCILVVTHAGVIRVLLHNMLKHTPEQMFERKIDYGHLFVLSGE